MILQRRIGFERLELYVTSRRIIIAHESKKGLGALALTPLLGRYGGSSEGSSKERSWSGGRGKIEAKSPQSVLVAHKDNFALSYEELVSVELHRSSETTNIIILTQGEKFQFSTDMDFSEVAGFLAAKLGTKLIV